ncbi:beta-lactamase family protein [Luteibacter anthropi]|uniref:serine hydrolase domain-containing protein n=1 Tax=Luteibacter anthropi TaxID=564369 RepID=UPI00203296D0|nr:serine hydrolase domain-containing protein [Luteibacter anthropi]URX63965.1 beta-lactamase family protein [Luteibacter anthropi]
MLAPHLARRKGIRFTLRIATLAAALAALPFTVNATIAIQDSPEGKLGDQLVQRIDTNNPATLRTWAERVITPTMPKDDRAAFLSELMIANRESGGLDVVDRRSDAHQPGMLQLAVRARRDGRQGLFVLVVDPKQPDKLAQATLFPMEDAGLYATWPKGPVSQEQIARLVRGAIDRLATADGFSGCVTVKVAGAVLVNECRGMAERSFAVPIDDHTRFHVGSIGKMFTAVAIAQLVESGKLSWKTTLAEALPEYPDQQLARRITLWQLLHHTAGLGDFMVDEYFQHRERYIDPGDYLSLIAHQPVTGEPGKQWNYSNAGYVLLGRIVEKVSRETYDDYIQHHVFALAGMTSSGFDRLDDVIPRLATGYYREGVFSRDWKAAWMKLGAKGGPAGGGYSTNADLIAFATALHDGKLVNAATLSTLFDDEVPAGPGAYAAGFGDRLSHGVHIRGHTGGIEGTTANLQIVWETGAIVALTSNEGPTQHWMLVEHIADLLAAEAPASPAP